MGQFLSVNGIISAVCIGASNDGFIFAAYKQNRAFWRTAELARHNVSRAGRQSPDIAIEIDNTIRHRPTSPAAMHELGRRRTISNAEIVIQCCTPTVWPRHRKSRIGAIGNTAAAQRLSVERNRSTEGPSMSNFDAPPVTCCRD
ncbi:hypothetical protein G3O00_35715 [Burkholderia sp. Ac-20384]|uniref:hypothetical protein n=1 Tax=Burkholderia sp. Ac-20384 TaxID=2703902 RepID=UPI00197F4B04|nr:hypothetical protein [Burkholderia sp. Ac-20384]MBN3828914.1 hypothetical protein [Burkholderia sp. Ac-20384]